MFTPCWALVQTPSYISQATTLPTYLSPKESQEEGLLAGVGGIVVSIAAFQAVDPGSIPGQRNRAFKKNFSPLSLGLVPVSRVQGRVRRQLPATPAGCTPHAPLIENSALDSPPGMAVPVHRRRREEAKGNKTQARCPVRSGARARVSARLRAKASATPEGSGVVLCEGRANGFQSETSKKNKHCAPPRRGIEPRSPA